MTILDKIAETKTEYVNRRKEMFPLALLKESIHYNAPCVSLSQYIKRPDKSGIIAEFKRKSPSKGYINKYASVDEITLGYMQSGASALSILTDEPYFGGTDEDLRLARKLNYCPILRKDFIIDSYQIHEARSIGADAVLLIARLLTKEHIEEYSELAVKLGMEVLLELHEEAELEKLPKSNVLVGINNRDLTTFKVDIDRSIKMLSDLPKDAVKIAESGIDSPETLLRLREAGFDGFLIGERFMAAPQPEKACRAFIKQIEKCLHTYA